MNTSTGKTFFEHIYSLRETGINPAVIVCDSLEAIGISTRGLAKVQGTPEGYWLQYANGTVDGRRVSLTENDLEKIWERITYYPPLPDPL